MLPRKIRSNGSSLKRDDICDTVRRNKGENSLLNYYYDTIASEKIESAELEEMVVVPNQRDRRKRI